QSARRCGEKGVGADEEGIRPRTLHTFESSTDLTAGVGVEDLDLQAHGASSRFYLSHCRLGLGSTGRINEYRDTRSLRQQLAQEFQPLCRQLGREETDAGEIPARPSEAGNEANSDRVVTAHEDDGDQLRCALRC